MTKRVVVKKPKGRPSKYHDKVPEQAAKLAVAGWTDKQMANFFGVSEATFNTWKLVQPAFLEALKQKDVANADVEISLFKRACGYSHPDVHISNFQGLITVTPIVKHYPPDPTAMIFWLKNRDRARWRDKPDPEDDEAPVTPVKVEVRVEDASKPDADAK